ncbi:MAG: NUDIX hydrolase [Candidatus Latescibacteria bacterium]|jgi:ADP-ribose pyrophosphatase YjhB (NUDIX family)|nr:NUDIX hydrolase [Candidatus Latescibacterota bacterium]
MNPKVRVTGILIEDGEILLVEQLVTNLCRWSLPGGTLEFGESIEAGLKREMVEETGLGVDVERLLYVCDRLYDDTHVVHMTFEIKRVDGTLIVGEEPESDANPITDVAMVPLDDLETYGFAVRFRELAENGFPNSGTYRGLVENIGL